jgi:hypothetical protein
MVGDELIGSPPIRCYQTRNRGTEVSDSTCTCNDEGLQLDVSERCRAPWMRDLTCDLIGAESMVSTIKTYTRRR